MNLGLGLIYKRLIRFSMHELLLPLKMPVSYSMKCLRRTRSLRSGDVKRALRDITSWSAMIIGYAQNGNHKRALLLFWSMVMNENEGLKPD
ncbi:hypothetical protein DVH24_010993 [Malus domestica]|uniref:Pentatricopeptide repeat-containing protein n=1 Tax=Malus domestica TaxID=3750 RepID=A0A498JSA6_MALDO|nr:hypothetical protein DVH24_010993 [Malus domestica]